MNAKRNKVLLINQYCRIFQYFFENIVLGLLYHNLKHSNEVLLREREGDISKQFIKRNYLVITTTKNG